MRFFAFLCLINFILSADVLYKEDKDPYNLSIKHFKAKGYSEAQIASLMSDKNESIGSNFLKAVAYDAYYHNEPYAKKFYQKIDRDFLYSKPFYWLIVADFYSRIGKYKKIRFMFSRVSCSALGGENRKKCLYLDGISYFMVNNRPNKSFLKAKNIYGNLNDLYYSYKSQKQEDEK